ncbi:tRNA wybutosine-synthesizing protein 4 [Trichoderma simmonsii]|uniref:tRNA wybutosine-synthesizing protein 4 n=1 Tax=Trichoderma simmonsii TaxID=1491479 RepID=A0A8G0L525_9HYPO|nr:tRNA wybutosine-synthesizing protein 4 [Trichoderma simmonsii]
MKGSLRALQFTRNWSSQARRASSRAFTSANGPKPSIPGAIDGLTFEESFRTERPYVFAGSKPSPTHTLPAFHKWFTRDDKDTTLSSYMDPFLQWDFPYELIKPAHRGSETIALLHDSLLNQGNIGRDLAAAIQTATAETSPQHQFFQLYAPLRLLVRALEFNKAQRLKANPPVQLYIAQSLLPDLPDALQSDVPAPELIRRVGKGDIYSSSIWLGTEPTYTPLHRDPNPNLFCQLCSSKVVRLMPPERGLALYNSVQKQLRRMGNSRIRSTEMMEGEEREMLHSAVWGDEPTATDIQEVTLRAGDGLFIPKGWWHSIRSEQSDGQLNGSANWWFR